MLLKLTSLTRLMIGLVYIGICVGVTVLCLVPLLPWRVRRIRVTNFFGSLIGAGIMRISGCRVTVKGREALSRDKPAIYAGNHTSIFDAFTTIWLTPSGTVGVAKKEILFYPFYGVCWWLAGHLLIDRANTEAAKKRMRGIGEFVRKNNLHVCIMPEGHRSRDGRLRAFKKGIAHMAIQTGLDIVPMVTTGATYAWEAGKLSLNPAKIEITFLPPVSTKSWSEDKISEHLAELQQVFVNALPVEQHPKTEKEDRAAA